jgi:hypothetical protein
VSCRRQPKPAWWDAHAFFILDPPARSSTYHEVHKWDRYCRWQRMSNLMLDISSTSTVHVKPCEGLYDCWLPETLFFRVGWLLETWGFPRLFSLGHAPVVTVVSRQQFSGSAVYFAHGSARGTWVGLWNATKCRGKKLLGLDSIEYCRTLLFIYHMYIIYIILNLNTCVTYFKVIYK